MTIVTLQAGQALTLSRAGPAGPPQLISTQVSSASDLDPQRIESPLLSGCSPARGEPFRVSPLRPRLAIHHRPSENVNLACSREIVGTPGSLSSTAPLPARAPDVRVSVTEPSVTSRSVGTGLRLSSVTVSMPVSASRSCSGCARVFPSWPVKPRYGPPGAGRHRLGPA